MISSFDESCEYILSLHSIIRIVELKDNESVEMILKSNEKNYLPEVQKIIKKVNEIGEEAGMAVYAEVVEKLCEEFLVGVGCLQLGVEMSC